MNVTINKELESLIPALSQEEYTGLEKDILTNGCISPLDVWHQQEGSPIILDGHNRYKICQTHGISFKIREVANITSIIDAKIWMIRNQFNRRNMNVYTRSILALELESIFQQKAKENKRAAGKISGRGKNEKVWQKSAKPIETRKEVANIAGVSRDTISKVKKVKQKATPEIKEKLTHGTMSINEAYKRVKREEQKQQRQEVAKQLEVETHKAYVLLSEIITLYRIFYADPPWKYGNDYTQAMPGSTRPDDHYPPMETSDICALPVNKLSMNNAVLFLWVVPALLPDGLDVCRSWGFTYKTNMCWDKVKHNWGPYLSMRHELLYICTKGACTPDINKLINSVQRIERTEHSRKPEKFREIIDELYPFGNRLELFARGESRNWDTWGNEIEA